MENNYKRRIDKLENTKTNIFEDVATKTKYNDIIIEKNKIPVWGKLLIFLAFLITLAFSSYLIYDSFNKSNQIYLIINAILIFITVSSFLIAFKNNYHKKKSKANVFTILFIISLIIFNGLCLTNILKLPTESTMPSFINKNLTQALKWSEKNNIKTNQTFEYSDNVKKYDIINQDIKDGALTKNIKNINFEVSNGPDYNKEVVIADMTDWNIDDAVKVIDENFLNNVNIEFEENTDIDRDIILQQDLKGNVKRNDKINIKVSLGDKNKLKDIKLKNLKNQSLFKATLYLNRNAIDYEIKYKFSNKIDKGNVISTSNKKGTKLSPKDKITLTVSKGKKIIVPDLKNKKMSYINKWMIENNLKINYSDKYDDSIKNGHVIEATYKKGDVIEEETTIGITVSKGKLKMPKFKNLTEFKSWAEKYNIKYEIKEEFNQEIKKDEIIKFSIKPNTKIKKDETIIVYVSKGKEITMPNFIGESKTSIQNTCNKLNINCSFIVEYNTTVKEGTAISQSIQANQKIAEGTNIQINIASKNKNEVTKNNRTNTNTTQKNNKNNNSNSNSGQTCKNYELNLGYGSTGAQTKQIIAGQNPNLKFSWNPVSTCPNGDKEPGTICSSSASDGSTVSSCTTIKITYVN